MILYRYHIVRNFTFVLILCNVSTLWLQLLSLNTLLYISDVVLEANALPRGTSRQHLVLPRPCLEECLPRPRLGLASTFLPRPRPCLESSASALPRPQFKYY